VIMRTIGTILLCTVIGSVLFGNPTLSEILTPYDSDRSCDQILNPCQDSLHFCETKNHALGGLDSVGKGLNSAVFNYSAPSGYGAISSHLITRVGHADDPGSSAVLSDKSPHGQNGQSVSSKKNLKNREILDSADRRVVDRLGEPQNLPAPLVAAIIALIGVVAVARRKIT